MPKIKRDINILITQTIESARILRTIAENKGFADRKKYIEYLCEQQVIQFIKKQKELPL
jgi:hypothetical protein